jgi:hypothetical protein
VTIGYVVAKREEYISFFLDRTKSHFDELQKMDGCRHNDICNAVRIGSLILSLHLIDILPGKTTTSDVTASIAEIEDAITSYNPFSPVYRGPGDDFQGIDQTLKEIKRKDLCDLKHMYLADYWDGYEGEGRSHIPSELLEHIAAASVK